MKLTRLCDKWNAAEGLKKNGGLHMKMKREWGKSNLWQGIYLPAG
jgi:hypothetical protein